MGGLLVFILEIFHGIRHLLSRADSCCNNRICYRGTHPHHSAHHQFLKAVLQSQGRRRMPAVGRGIGSWYVRRTVGQCRPICHQPYMLDGSRSTKYSTQSWYSLFSRFLSVG